MRMKWYRAFTFLFTSVATGLAAAFLVLLLRPDLVGYESTPVPAAAQPVLLERSGGRVGEAALRSGLAPRTLYDLLRRHGLRGQDYRFRKPVRHA